MKKIFGFVLIGLLASTIVMAQTVTRKIPFLPYTGITPPKKIGSASISTSTKAKTKTYETVYFDKDSDTLRPDQKQKIIRIGKRLEKVGSGHYSIVGFTAPNISKTLAEDRVQTVIHALSDFKIGSPVVHYEHRKSTVVNPNRVEIYMKASTSSLGSASSNFNAP